MNTVPDDYTAARALLDKLDAETRAASQHLRQTAADTAARLGLPTRGLMGLTPDAVKADSGWRAAYVAYWQTMSRARAYVGPFMRKHKRRHREETRRK